ncbi:MAG: hypothetical protein ACRC6I_14500 [Paracoccaceae bacterium]
MSEEANIETTEYPKALYRDGETYDINGIGADIITVNDADEELAADGYKTAAEFFASKVKPEESAKPKK